MSKNSIHIRAIDWALGEGYFISVRDYSETEFDIKRSQDRAAIIEAVEATELPNVYISVFIPIRLPAWRRIAVFSVIDEGEPLETINDYIARSGGVFDKWFNTAQGGGR